MNPFELGDVDSTAGPSPEVMDAMYSAWTVIANARDWLLDDPQAVEWRAAAERWRDEDFHPMLDARIRQIRG